MYQFRVIQYSWISAVDVKFNCWGRTSPLAIWSTQLSNELVAGEQGITAVNQADDLCPSSVKVLNLQCFPFIVWCFISEQLCICTTNTSELRAKCSIIFSSSQFPVALVIFYFTVNKLRTWFNLFHFYVYVRSEGGV